jgi:DNA helicase-2/ATP-dependent DNA helicase PcrA
MNQLCITDNITLGNFIDKANELEIYPIDDKLRNYIEKYEYVYNRIRSVSYKEFLNYYNYMEGKTPFSTQHKTKGSEYENVLVLLESKWNKYNFGYMMGNKPARKSNSYDSVVNRTLKLFYVCCTRAKNHLIVFYSCPEPTVLDRAKEWFGKENVYKLPIDALLKGKSET